MPILPSTWCLLMFDVHVSNRVPCYGVFPRAVEWDMHCHAHATCVIACIHSRHGFARWVVDRPVCIRTQIGTYHLNVGKHVVFDRYDLHLHDHLASGRFPLFGRMWLVTLSFERARSNIEGVRHPVACAEVVAATSFEFERYLRSRTSCLCMVERFLWCSASDVSLAVLLLHRGDVGYA